VVLLVVGVGGAACASHSVGLSLGIIGVFAGIVFDIKHRVVVRLAMLEVFGVMVFVCCYSNC